MTRNPSSIFRFLPRSLAAVLIFLAISAAQVASAILPSSPSISATPASLSGFTSLIGSASASQSFTVNGSLLTDDITVTTTGTFEISSNNSSFSQNLTLTQSGGNVTAATVYARIAGNATIGAVSGNILLSSTNATNVEVSVNGTVSPLPSISATPTSLSGFETALGTASDQQSFTVNGTDLLEDVTVTATGSFEVSTTSNGSFSPTLSLPQSGGSVNATIYTRIASTAPVGLASGNITLASANATDAVVSTNGTVNGPLAIAITGQPIQTRAGSLIIATQSPSTTYPRVRITSNGTAVGNVTVTAVISSGNFTVNSTTTASTDSGGNATFSNLVLTQAAAGYTITFTGNKTYYPSGNTTSVQFPIIAAAAANATLTTAPGNTTYGSGLTPAAVVTLTDLYGNPVSNTNITARLSNNGTFASSSSNATVRTTTNGTATYSNLVPAQAGNFTITFDPAAGGVPDVTSNITVSPLATTLTIGNATMTAAASLPSDLVVTPGPSFSTTAFSQDASAILGNFTYTSSNTTAVGNHTLSITPSGNGTFANYAITYNNGTLTVTAGNATALTELAAPVTTEAGRPIEGVNLDTFSPEPPTIFVGDQFGNPVSGITVNATISTNPGNATLNGTTSVQTVGGNATFSDLVITKAADGYKLTFSATGLTDLVTEEFNIEPASAHDIVVFTQPGNTTAGQLIPGSDSPNFGTYPAVQVLDEYDNPVNRAYNVETTLVTGNFTANSTTIELTDSTGYGVFDNLTTTQSGTFQIQFAPLAAGNIATTSANFTVDPDFGSANISVSTQPGNSTAGELLAGPPSAQIRDQYANPIGNYTVNATLSTGSFSVNSTTSNTTDTTGTATLGDLRIETAGNYTLTLAFSETTSANSSVTTSNFTVSPAAPAKLVMVTEPSSTAQAGIALATQPAVRLQDAFSNNVLSSGTSVSASATGTGNGTAGGNTTASTDGNGTASFAGLSINGTVGNYTLTFSSGILTSVNATTTIALSAGNATQLSVSTQPSSTAMANATFSQQPVVQILDNWSNLVSTDNSTVVAASLNTNGLNGTFSGNASGPGVPTVTGNITVGSSPFNVAFNPAGTLAYVTNTGGNEVSVIDTATGTVTDTISVGSAPFGVAFNPAGTLAYVANYSSNTVSVIDTASGTVTVTISVGSNPFSVAFNPAGTLAYVTNSGSASVSVIDTASGTVTVTISVGSDPFGVAFNPAGTLAYVTNLASSTVSVIDTANSTVTGNISVGSSPIGVAFNPTGTLAYVANTGSNSISVIDTATGTVTGNISVGFYPSGVAFNPAGTLAYVTNLTSSTVSVIDTANSTVTGNISVGNSPIGVAFNPAGTLAYVVNSGIDSVSVIATPSSGISATASGGNASFSGLAIAGQAGNYTLNFSSGSLANATSSNVTITADLTTANITMGTQPGNSTAGSAIPGSPSVSILDQYSNPVGNYTVNAVLNGATLTSNSTRNVATGTDGNATFSNLITNTAGTGYTLAFSFNATTPTTASNSTTSANFTVAPDAAYGLVMVSQPPTTAQAGVPFDDANAPQVRVKDRFNNNVPAANMTITATANGGPGNASGATTALTDMSGTATFLGLGISGSTGVYTLTFANGTLTTNATSNSVTLTPGIPTKIVVAQQPPATVQANATLTPAPAVGLQDTWDNNVTTPGITVNATLQGGGASLNGTGSTTTNATGVANFGDLRIQGSVGIYTLQFTSGNFASANSTNIEVTADQSTATISITSNATTSTAGQTIQGSPAATIEDQYGNALSGYSVSAALNGATLASGATTANTDGSGTATFGDLVTNTAGDFTLTLSFNENGASGNATTANFTVNPDAAAALAITTQPSSTAQAGIALAQQPVIQVKDQFGNNAPASGLVIAATSNGSATANGTTTATTSNGTASFSGLLLEGIAGNYTLTFGNGTLTSVTSNSIALGAGTAVKLAVTTQPGNSTAAGDAFNPQPAVSLQDAWNNAVSQGNVTVTAAVTTGNASVGGNTTATSAGDGVALFDGLTIAGQVGDYTLTFNATTLADAISNTVAVTANPATAVISISTNATTSIAGQAFAGLPAATIVDGSGNPLNGISVSAAINQNSGNFSGTTSVSTNSTGVASFGNLTQTVAASGYNLTLAFTSGNASGNATTANFSVTSASAANMTVSRQPINTIAGVVIAGSGGGSPSARLRDAFGNPVISQNVTVTLQTGNFTGNSTSIVATDSTGNATFSNLVCTTAGFYNLSFASGNLSRVTNGFNIFASAGTSLALVNTLQTTAQAGVALSPQPIVQIRDTFGNNATQSGVTITVASLPVGISGGNTSVLTNGNGTATYSGLFLTEAVGNRTLTFSAAGLTSAVSPEIDLTAGAVDSLIVSVQPSTVFIAGNELRGADNVGFPAVTVKDAYNNPVSATVNATGVGFTNFGNGSVTSRQTDGNGTAVFTNLMVVEAGQNQRVNFASGNVSANTNTFNVFPGDPVSMAVTAQPPTSIASGVVLSPNPEVTLYDAFSNTVTDDYDVMVSLGSGNGTLSGTTNMTTTGGVATFTSLSIAQLGNYTLSFRTLDYDPEITDTSNQFSVVSPTASGLAITGISAVDATTYQIAFTAAQGGQYWIERTTDLTSGVWTYVSGTAETATTGANTVNVTSPGGTKAFWRLTTQQPVP